MPRLTRKNPSYRKHRATGQTIVVLDGRTFYLGPSGTAASRVEYDRLIGEWLANGRRLPSARDVTSDRHVVESIDAFWTFAQDQYEGNTTNGELGAYRAVLRLLKRLYASCPIAQFGPASLMSMQRALLRQFP